MTLDRARELIEKHLDGIAGDAERAELDRLLAASPEAAALFTRLSRHEHDLESAFHEENAAARFTASLRGAGRPRFRLAWAAAAAALLAAGLWFFLGNASPAATIVGAGPGSTVEREGSARPAAVGLDLLEGDVLRGTATILLERDAARVQCRGDVELLVGRDRLELRKGVLDASVTKRPADRPLVFATPLAEARILGTRFSLSVGRLEVQEGRVRFTRLADGASVDVAAGQLAVAAPSAALVARSIHEERFLELRRELHDPANGYFSKDGVPYHSAETFVVDAPDHGHLSTSETFSYWIWLEAMYGRLTGDWAPLNAAWRKMEETLIPAAHASSRAYDPKKPAAYVPERDSPAEYPVSIDPSAPVGEDPLAKELESSWGSPDLYGMHWLLDPDDWYGFGRRNGLVNTFQRGPQESVWETIPHPSMETFSSGGPNGYLDLFIRENAYAKQWRYTCAPDADLRAIQAMYWAARWAAEQKKDPAATLPLRKAARMGDTLRYALHDKYFRGAHGLVSWLYAWGGSADPASPWAWRTGGSHVHFGYQNPFAAWVLAEDKDFRAPSPGAAADWSRSLSRQLEFYRWLQAEEGAIAGGATASWRGRYETPPAGTALFHGLAYDPHPVFHDPPSNEWFGWQAWSMERLAEYASVSGDPRAKDVVDRWAAWARREVRLEGDGYSIPSTLRWSGQPGAGLHVAVVDRGQDVGIAAALARVLARHGAPESRALAAEILDRMWRLHRDEKGVAAPEARGDYNRFFDPVVVPDGWKGPLKPGATFLDVRPQYRNDPELTRVEQAVRKGEPPVFRIHRFWAQVEIALANAELSMRRKP